MLKDSITTISLLVAMLVSPLCQAMTLGEAVQEAIQNDPLVRESDALFAAEQQLGAQVASTLRPTVSAQGTLARNRNQNESQFFGSFEETYNDNTVGISARQLVYRYDWFALRKHATALDAQADASLLQRQQAFALRITERYFAVLMAQAGLDLAQADADAINESLEDTRKRFEVGLVAGTDLKEAQARKDLAQARLILARDQVASARETLDESTGRGFEPLPQLDENAGLPAVMPDDPDAWVVKARAQNPILLQADQEVVIAEATAKTALADILPRVDAVASYRELDTSESLIGSERDEARIGLELNVPIYAGGLGQARKREAAARLELAEAKKRRLLAETERLTRQRFRELKTAYAQDRALKVAAQSAEAAEIATRNGYEAGTRTITDVLNARSAVIAARREQVINRYNLLLNWLRLKETTAELGNDDFSQIDGLLSQPASNESGEQS